MDKQVDKEHYNFNKYMHIGRWSSYYYQMREVLKPEPKEVLEIGIGDKVLGQYLKNNTSVSYTSIDIDEDLEPDIVGSVLNLPFADNSFDVVCAFEVLEHLPFENFEQALLEIKRVTKKKAVLSLPHFGPQVRFLLKIPLIPLLQFAKKIYYPKQHFFNGEHYWEIGKKKYSTYKIKKIISKFFEIEDEFIPFENQYHHFFVLKVKNE